MRLTTVRLIAPAVAPFSVLFRDTLQLSFTPSCHPMISSSAIPRNEDCYQYRRPRTSRQPSPSFSRSTIRGVVSCSHGLHHIWPPTPVTNRPPSSDAGINQGAITVPSNSAPSPFVVKPFDQRIVHIFGEQGTSRPVTGKENPWAERNTRFQQRLRGGEEGRHRTICLFVLSNAAF